jgi:hypothetical protein
MAKRNITDVRGVTIGAMLLAISVITLYIQTILPVANFTLYMLSSFYIAFVIMETGPKAGWLFYFASIILAVIFVPDKIFLIPYVLFFGIYGMAKYYIERLRKLPLEWALKIIFFNSALGILILFFQELIIGRISLPDLPVAILLGALEAAFIAYDYLYTLVIEFYTKRIKVSK